MKITEGKVEAEVSAYHCISIPVQLYNDLCGIVDHYDTEVSGCGMVERVEHRFKSEDKDEADTIEIEFAIREIYLPEKQSNTRASTDIDDDVIADLMSSLLKQGKNTEHLRLHWHSHADMDTFHSGTDEENYTTLSNGDFLVSLVLNKAHKFLGRVDYFKPFRVTLSNIAVHLILENENKISKSIEESIKKLDKYTKENIVVYPGVQSEFGYTQYGKSIVTEKDDLEEDIEIGIQLGLTKDEALRFRNCFQTSCHCCKEADKCQDYLMHIDKLNYNY